MEGEAAIDVDNMGWSSRSCDSTIVADSAGNSDDTRGANPGRSRRRAQLLLLDGTHASSRATRVLAIYDGTSPAEGDGLTFDLAEIIEALGAPALAARWRILPGSPT
jgi:hypothetical protein